MKQQTLPVQDKNHRNILFIFRHKHSFHIHSLSHNYFENVKFSVYHSAICLLQLHAHAHAHAHTHMRPWLKSQFVFSKFSPHTTLHIIRSPSQEHCRGQPCRYDSIFARMESWAANKTDNLQNSHTVTVQCDNSSERKNKVLCTGHIQVLWGLKLIQFLGPSLWIRIQN